MKHVAKHEQALAKYNWALKQIHALNAVLDSFGKDQNIIALRANPENDTITYYIHHVPELPREIPLLAGDVLHNLRCSLDYVFCGMLLAADVKLKENTKFPIYGAAEFFNSVLPTKTEGLEEQAIEGIKRIKPYKGGNTLLWQLHKLNNIDKHRLLLTMSLINVGRTLTPREESELEPAEQVFSGRHKSGFRFTISKAKTTPAPLRPGLEILTLPSSEFYENMGFSINVSINEAGVAESVPLSLLLSLIGMEVKYTIRDLSKFL
jgi:hypothetical protein